METGSDPYQVLGVPADASADAIKRAYRRLAREHHPDLASGPDAARRFQRVQQAYEALSDPVRRAQIDAGRRRRTASSWGPAAAGPRGGTGAGPGRDDATTGFVDGLSDALRRLLDQLGIGSGMTLEDLLDLLPASVRETVREAASGERSQGLFEDLHGHVQRPMRVLGGGEIEVDVLLTAHGASRGATIPFRYHLGPTLVDEQLRVPAGTQSGNRHTYSIPIDAALTLRVTLCIQVEPGAASTGRARAAPRRPPH